MTPLRPDGSVDRASLERLVEFELAGGVAGVFALGTGGEGPYLDDVRRLEATQGAVEAVGGRAPVLVGVSDIGTSRAVHNARMAISAGADGLVCTAPFYGEVGAAEIEAHFRALAVVAGPVPLYAYDIPSKVGVKLPIDVIVRLGEEGVLKGVKDSSGDLDEFRRLRMATRAITGFSLITGSDSFADVALLEGATGMIAGLANVDPEGFVRLFDLAKDGNWKAAREEQDRLFALRDIVSVAVPRVSSFSATIGSFKAALVARGIIECDALQEPLRGLNATERAVVRAMVQEAGLSVVAERSGE